MYTFQRIKPWKTCYSFGVENNKYEVSEWCNVIMFWFAHSMVQTLSLHIKLYSIDTITQLFFIFIFVGLPLSRNILNRGCYCWTSKPLQYICVDILDLPLTAVTAFTFGMSKWCIAVLKHYLIFLLSKVHLSYVSRLLCCGQIVQEKSMLVLMEGLFYFYFICLE